MKIHFAPKVILLARPSIDWTGVAEFLAEYGETPFSWRRGEADSDGDSLPELAGRACYGSFGDRQGRIGASDYMTHVIESGHGSVLEHAQWTFAICRASRGFTHQMIRHRAGTAFSQESQHFIHYAEEGKGTQQPAICLTGIPDGPAREFAVSECERSTQGYARLWDLIRSTLPADAIGIKKVVSGSSRGLLPGAAESRLVMSANARALRHIVELRGNEANTLEIRLVARCLAQIMKIEAPAIFADFEESTGSDGYPVMSCKWHKV